MKYRLHIASLAIAVLPLLTSCSDSYPGMDFPVDDSHVSNNESLNNTPIMVFINPQKFFSVSSTRASEFGTGVFDASDEVKYKNKYNNSDFYIYAFRSSRYVSGKVLPEPDFTKSRWNAAGDEEKDGLYCLVDGPGGRGLRARLTADEPGALSFNFKDETGSTNAGENDFLQYASGNDHDYMKYFSSNNPDVPYNFFGYFIDNIDSVRTLKRTSADEIKYEFYIDGSQDIMCGYAPFSKKVLDDNKGVIAGLKSEEYDKILNYGGFTTYAAHRSFYPEIGLRHQLVRLVFSAYPGGKNADDIRIDAIAVKCRTKCTLTVASTDTARVGATFDDPFSEEWLYLREDSKDGVAPTTPFDPVFLSDQTDSSGKKAWTFDEYSKGGTLPYPLGGGGSMLVPESQEGKYSLMIKFSQRIWDQDHEEHPDAKYTMKEGYVYYTLALSNNKPFLKGHYYPISISIYGYEDIRVSANIQHWIEGGGIDIGDDTKYDDYLNGEGQVFEEEQEGK